jgi:Ca-activated chloride channel family protein
MGDLFVGLGTNIDLDTFERRPQNLAVIVDRSGSMEFSASADDNRSKMDAVKEALNRLVDQLDENDILTLLSFNSQVFIDVPSAFVRDRDLFRDAINRMKPEGNTDLYAALLRGFEKAEAQIGKGRDNRVIMLTDALPTVGSTLPSDIAKLVRDYAKRGIGFTLLGVGDDFGTDLAQEVVDVRDANYFFLADSDRIRTVFDDFRFMVTPAAYDMTLEVRVADGVGIRDVYGVPDYTPGQRGARIEVPTLFFSRREGGGSIVVRLTSAEAPTFEEAVTAGNALLSYTLPDGTRRHGETALTLPAGLSSTGDPPWFSESSARRAALLLDTVLVLKDATRAAWNRNYNDAARMIEEFLPFFDQASLGMSDRTDPSSRGLKDERQVLEELLSNVRDGYVYRYY